MKHKFLYGSLVLLRQPHLIVFNITHKKLKFYNKEEQLWIY